MTDEPLTVGNLKVGTLRVYVSEQDDEYDETGHDENWRLDAAWSEPEESGPTFWLQDSAMLYQIEWKAFADALEAAGYKAPRWRRSFQSPLQSVKSRLKARSTADISSI